MPRPSLTRLPVSRQLLLLQLVIVIVVVIAVAGVSLSQSAREYRSSAAARSLALAETAATDSVVRIGLEPPLNADVVAPAATRLQTISGADYVVVTDAEGAVVAAQDPRALRTAWSLAAEALAGRAWSGPSASSTVDATESQVPILDATTATVLGYAVVGIYEPDLAERLGDSGPRLLLYLGIASTLGVAGSSLVARRIKKQTFGLEPREIAGLVENREALLHNIREGVVGLDTEQHVTLVNDEATRLLGLPSDVVGQPVHALPLDDVVRTTLARSEAVSDLVLSAGTRLVSVSLQPVRTDGRRIGTVATLRDRTELAGIQRELDVTRRTADSLRAQAHEFTNRLHTISGLLHTRRVEHAIAYISEIDAVQRHVTQTVTTQIEDPTLAALLIAKISLAHEAGAELVLASESALDEVPLDVAADLETIIGNFLDNALDAVRATPDAQVDLLLRHHGGRIEVQVTDTGPGIDESLIPHVFERGVTTKTTSAATTEHGRGIGLALARLVTRRRGGDATARNLTLTDNDHATGAVLHAWFPYQSDHNER